MAKCKKCDNDLIGVVVAGCCLKCYRKWQKQNENYQAKERLKYLRGEILAERISYGEIAELQSLAKYIDGDVLLMEWAGVPEVIK